MSVDPERPAADPPPTGVPTESAGENAEAIRLKRRFKKSGSEAEDGGKPDQTIELLSTLLQDLIAKKEGTGASESEPKAARFHRLSRKGGSPAAPGDAAPAPPGVEAAASPVTAAATFRAAQAFKPLAAARRIRRLHILYPLGALVLAGAAYYAGSQSERREAGLTVASKAASPTLWDDAALSQLDQALVADQTGDLKGAQRIASALQKPGVPAPPGLDLYLASVESRLARSFDVEADLKHALLTASPEAAARINEGLAFNFSRARDFVKATEYLQTASRLDPFSASLFYHWGETLRRLGHFPEASDAFRRALDRLPTGQPETASLRECIQLKSRLVLVELGRDGELQTELAEQLKAARPSGYWLLTAAAVALQHKDLAGGADYLRRTRDALGAATFDALLNDYLFRAYADRKELADFFPPDPAARRAQLQPTMTYTVEP